MALEITLTLSTEELEKFQQSVDKGRNLVSDAAVAQEVESAAAELVEKTRTIELPAFITDRISKLQVLIDMVRDDEWQLSDEERQSIRSALYYFVDPEDAIPDSIPGIGYLDDAIYAEIVLKELTGEVNMYREFCDYRTAEEGRRRNRGLDPHVGREDWLADKRAVLHAKMRQGRSLRRSHGGWGLKLL